MTLWVNLSLICYGLLVYLVSQSLISRRLLQGMEAMQEVFVRHESLELQRNELLSAKSAAQQQAQDIFTLYDMTKEITKSFNEDAAFAVFKRKLLENHISCRECRLLSPESPTVKALKKEPDSQLFTLKGKKKRTGYLLLKGIRPQDNDKLQILVQQFSLGFRRIRLYQEVERLAIHDSLTELYTRRYIMDRFAEEVQRAGARKNDLSFIMLDVDHFKVLNDHHGHLTGDQVLREVTLRLQDNIREIDIPGRYGGEELCVILPDTDREGAIYVAERIRESIANSPVQAYDTKVCVTVSIGISTFPEDGDRLEALIDKADWALYRAKKLGRNRVCAFGHYEGDT